jgi:hypothetical protein
LSFTSLARGFRTSENINLNGTTSTNPVYQPLGKKEIRLLTIETISKDTATCRLETFQRTEAPEYDAVTYTWGDATVPVSITCNGFDLSIRRSLLVAIEHFHEAMPLPRRPLWIDAICLNQEDNIEKALHVPRMGKIYQSASRTIVWLGEAGDDSDLAMEGLYPLLGALSKVTDDDDELGLQSLPEPESPISLALGRLFDRSWFHRLWTMQEAAFSDHLVVTCGRKSIEWAAFPKLLEELSRAGRLSLLLRMSLNIDNLSLLEPVHKLQLLRDDIKNNGDGVSMGVLLDWGKERICTEPIDRVWAILGLLTKADRQAIRKSRVIDYSVAGRRNYWKSFLGISKIQIKQDKRTALLLLSNDVAHAKTPRLPSWCPDWQAQRLYVPFTSFHAGYPDSAILLCPAIVVTPGASLLKILGFVIDTIGQVAEMCGYENLTPGTDISFRKRNGIEPLTATVLKWRAECFEIAKEVLDHDTNEAINETLLAHNPEKDNFSPENWWEKFMLFLKIMYEMASGMGLGPNTKARQSFNGPHFMLFRSYGGRKFFNTRNGRIGLGPPDIEPGDKVCVFTGGGPLFILRPLDQFSTKRSNGMPGCWFEE